MRTKNYPEGTVRSPDPSDPRSLDHPSHREQWLELADALGRLIAQRVFERLYGEPERQDEDGITKIKDRDRDTT